MPPKVIWYSWYHSPILVVARVHEVRAVRKARGAHERRIALAEQAAEDVEDAAERVRAARKRGGLQRLEQRARWNAHFHQVVEAVVEEDLRVEHHDHVDAREHLEHLFVQQEVDRRDRLRVGAREVEDALVPFAPHRARDLVRPHVEAVVADVVLEVLLLLRDRLADELAHGALVALEHGVHRRIEHVVAEARRDLDAADRGRAQRRGDGVEVREVPGGQAAVVQDHLEQVVLHHPGLDDLDRRDRDALLVDRAGIRRQRARHLAAHVRHVTEHGGPRDDAAVLVDRHQHEPVVLVADRAVDRVRVVGQEDVALLHGAVVTLQEAVDERAELADDHLAVEVGDQRELVVLLADAGRHGRAEQHRVHFETGVAQGALDDVDGDGIDLHLLHRLLVALDDLGGHVRISGSVAAAVLLLGLADGFFRRSPGLHGSRLRLRCARLASAPGNRRGRSGCCRGHPPCRGAAAGSPRSSPFPSRSRDRRCDCRP